MQSFREDTAPEAASPTLSISVPVALAVAGGTLPLLAFVMAERVISEMLTEMGQASEELFRGDRLPTRPLMKQPPTKDR